MRNKVVVPIIGPTILSFIILVMVWDLVSTLIGTFIVFLFLYLIVHRLIYGKIIGDKITAFACEIYDSNMELIARFQEKDWQRIKIPSTLVEMKDEIVENVIKESGVTIDKQIIINFAELHRQETDRHWKKMFPDNLNLIINNLQGKLYNDVKKFYDILPKRGKELLAKTIRSVVDYQISPKQPPKLWEIVSLSAGLHLYFIAQGEPADYADHRTAKKFKKWRALPFYGGFPVVRMWGSRTKFDKIIEGEVFPSIICRPIMDEAFLQERMLNLSKFAIAAAALTTYAENLQYLYPHMSDITALQTRANMLEIAWQKLMTKVSGFEEIVGELSEIAFTSQAIAMELSGKIVDIEGLPKDIQELAKKSQKIIEEKAKTTKSLKEKITGLVKKEKQPLPVVPPEDQPQT